MALTLRGFIADSLRGASPAADWNAGGVDRAFELADKLIAQGITDITKLGLKVVETEAFQSGLEWGQIVGDVIETPIAQTQHEINKSMPQRIYRSGIIRALVFDYAGKEIGYFGFKPHATLEAKRNTFHGVEFAWSAEGHGHVKYVVHLGPDGFLLQPRWASSSDWGEFRDVLKTTAWFFGSVYMMIGGSAIASQIGSAILGESVALAYPLLTKYVGNVALSTALNGGNVEKATQTALLMTGGAEIAADVSGYVKDATDLKIAGQVAGAVTNAAIRGGDIERAATLTLLANAGDTIDVFVPESESVKMPSDFDFGFDGGSTGDPYMPSVDDYVSAAQPDAMPEFSYRGGNFGAGSIPQVDTTMQNFSFDLPQGAYFGNDAFASGITSMPAFDYSGGNFGKAEAPLPPEPVETWSWANARNVINQASQTVLTAVTAVAALNKVANPKINPNAQNVAADGTVTRALDTGIVQTRLPDGRVVNARPPKDVAQSTVSGNVIVNNGDGTYTLISPDGRQRIIQYGADTGSALADLPWSYIGGGLAALLLLPKILK